MQRQYLLWFGAGMVGWLWPVRSVQVCSSLFSRFLLSFAMAQASMRSVEDHLARSSLRTGHNFLGVLRSMLTCLDDTSNSSSSSSSSSKSLSPFSRTGLPAKRMRGARHNRHRCFPCTANNGDMIVHDC
uniref:Putative secreted protein n=1 Tax=Anopheles darlingi TaxID=43151 RepID=A0A2M4DQS8_ANODA